MSKCPSKWFRLLGAQRSSQLSRCDSSISLIELVPAMINLSLR